MKHPVTGERAIAITASQLEAMQECIACHPAPHFVPNMQTSVALLNRGWIRKADPGAQITTRSMYYITDAGRTACRIAVRSAPCKRVSNS